MTFLDSRYGTSDLAYLISSFPNFLSPKESIRHLHITSRPNHLPPAFSALQVCMLYKDPVFAVTPLSPWDMAILCPPHLSTLDPSWPTGWGGGQDPGMGHRVPWPLSLKLLLWHRLGCLFLSDCLVPFDRKNILESIR